MSAYADRSPFSNNAGFFPRVSICDKVGWYCTQYQSYAVIVGVTSHARRPDQDSGLAPARRGGP
jgi:hypothetical protein